MNRLHHNYLKQRLPKLRRARELTQVRQAGYLEGVGVGERQTEKKWTQVVEEFPKFDERYENGRFAKSISVVPYPAPHHTITVVPLPVPLSRLGGGGPSLTQTMLRFEAVQHVKAFPSSIWRNGEEPYTIVVRWWVPELVL